MVAERKKMLIKYGVDNNSRGHMALFAFTKSDSSPGVKEPLYRSCITEHGNDNQAPAEEGEA